MKANPVLLQKKYARIIMLLSETLHITPLDALNKFYHSITYQLMREGVADMHCMSDTYLVAEIISELNEKAS